MRRNPTAADLPLLPDALPAAGEGGTRPQELQKRPLHLRMAGTMEMHVPPARGLPLPDAGLFAADRHRLAGIILHLLQPHVADHGHAAQQPHVGSQTVRL